MRHHIRVALLLAAIGLGWGPLTASAEEDPAPLSLEEAAEKVQAATDGRVLKAKRVETEDGTYFQIRVLIKPGEVRIYRVDPETGEIF